MKVVSMPVIRKAHQLQFWATPPCLTMSVTRFGVSVEKVVATMEKPRSHQGMERPERKKSSLDSPAFLETMMPTTSVKTRKPMMIPQSRAFTGMNS